MFRFLEKNLITEKDQSDIKPAGFGKIPNHADFVRYNLASREANTFERWLQEGVSCISRKYPKGWPATFKEFPCHHFVMTGSDQDRNLIGTMIGSHDKSGRTYPFATLALVNGSIFQKHRATLPLLCQYEFNAGRKLVETLATLPSAKALHKSLEKLAHHIPRPAERELLEGQIKLLSEHTMGEYWNSLDQDVPKSERERIFFTFFDFLRTVFKRGVTKCHWGVRIPLPAEKTPYPFIVFWVQMVESILENRFWRAHYFWDIASQKYAGSHLTLFFRSLPPSYLMSVIDRGCRDNVVFDVWKESQAISNVTSDIDLRRLLDNDDATLLDILYRIGRRESIL